MFIKRFALCWAWRRLLVTVCRYYHSGTCSQPDTQLPGTALVGMGHCQPRFQKSLHVGELRGGGHSEVGWGQHLDSEENIAK